MDIKYGDPGDEHEEPTILDSFNLKDHGIDLSTSMNIVKENGETRTIMADSISMADDLDEIEGCTVVEVTQADWDSGNVKCPYTNSPSIYRVSEGVYASFDTDEPFHVKIIDQ